MCIRDSHKPGICHNRACVNPTHLVWATAKENTAHRKIDGTYQWGEKSPGAKLTNDQAIEIFNLELPNSEIASRFGVKRAAVWRIKTGRSWSHITGLTYEAAP